DLPLTKGNEPVEIPTEYMCSDLLFTDINGGGRASDPNHQFLYVANRWRHSVLKYKVDVVLDSQNRPASITSSFVPEVLGVGFAPWRLALTEQKDAVLVTTAKGGEVARVQIASDQVTGHTSINGPSMDVVNINDLVIVPTLTIDRGLPTND